MSKTFLITILLVFFDLLLADDNNNTLQDFYLATRHEDEINQCFGDEDCAILGDFICINEICSCPPNTNCQEFDDIVHVTTLGEMCNHKDSCHIDNSVCSEEKKCVCQKGFVEAPSMKTCLEGNKKVGEACSEDTQCLTSFCHKTICKTRSALDGSCHTTEECQFIEKFSQCKDSKCVCFERYVADGGKCYLVSRELLSPCQVDVQCMKSLGNEGQCREEQCVCAEGYSYDAFLKKCVQGSGSSALLPYSFEVIVICAVVFTIIIL